MVGNQMEFVGIAEIETRIVREIGRALSEVSCVRPDAPDLSAMLRPFVDGLRRLLNRDLLEHLPPSDEETLRGLIDRPIERFDKQCRRDGASPAVVMLALSLVDDVLDALAALR